MNIFGKIFGKTTVEIATKTGMVDWGLVSGLMRKMYGPKVKINLARIGEGGIGRFIHQNKYKARVFILAEEFLPSSIEEARATGLPYGIIEKGEAVCFGPQTPAFA